MPSYDPYDESQARGTYSGGPESYTMTPDIQAAIEARRQAGLANIYTYQDATQNYSAQGVKHDNSPNAPAFQSLNPNDPNLSPTRWDGATNRDVLGNGKFGIRGWMNGHPLGVMAAFIAAGAGGAALSGAGGGGGAGAGAGAGSGAGSAGNLGIFANGGQAGMAGVGGGNAGALAASGGIAGGAGAGLGGTIAAQIPNVLRARQLLGGGQQAQPQASPQGPPQGQMPTMPSMGMLGSQMPQQSQMPQGNLFVNNQVNQLPQTKPFGPRVFDGQLIWT